MMDALGDGAIAKFVFSLTLVVESFQGSLHLARQLVTCFCVLSLFHSSGYKFRLKQVSPVCFVFPQWVQFPPCKCTLAFEFVFLLFITHRWFWVTGEKVSIVTPFWLLLKHDSSSSFCARYHCHLTNILSTQVSVSLFYRRTLFYIEHIALNLIHSII